MTHVQCTCGKVFMLHSGEALRVIKAKDNTSNEEWCVSHEVFKLDKKVVEVA